MIIGYVILGLFALAFLGISIVSIKVKIDYMKERERCKTEHCAESYTALKKRHTGIVLSYICRGLAVAVIITAVVLAAVGDRINDNSTSVTDPTINETEPETEETTEDIETPGEPSVPETEETIPEHLIRPDTAELINMDDPQPIPDPYDVELIALIIYQEVGGHAYCDNCRRYVADVVLNRVNDPRFPNTIEEVLLQKYQYGLLWQTGIKWPPRRVWPGEKAALLKAWFIAKDIMIRGNHSEIYSKGYVWQASFRQGDEGFWCCGMYYARGEW